MRRWHSEFRPGTWLAICDRCGFQYRNADLRLEWTGLRVCSPCFDTRHPQDYLQGKPDRQAPPWVRPDPSPTEIILQQRDDAAIELRDTAYVYERGTETTPDDL